MEWIGGLYAIEASIKERPPDDKHALRQEQALPLLTQMRTWLEVSLRSLLLKSLTAGAIGYALSNWQALTRYLEAGILDIDNNACERAIRPIATMRSLCPA